MASDPVTTSDTEPTMTTDPAAIPLPPSIVRSSPDKASFASPPREIRDKIYRLAPPHSCKISLVFAYALWPSGKYMILSLKPPPPRTLMRFVQCFSRKVDVDIYEDPYLLKHAIPNIAGAFKMLAEKLDRRLRFRLALTRKNDGQLDEDYIFTGGLEQLEITARVEDSEPEDENSDLEGEEE